MAPEIERDLLSSRSKPRKSLWGLWANLGPAPSAKEIDEAEKGRIQPDTYALLSSAISAQDAVLVVVPFDEIVAGYLHQVQRDQAPDLPDRIIAATALTLGVPVISRDSKIRLSSVATIR